MDFFDAQQVLLIYRLLFIVGGLFVSRIIQVVFKRINRRTDVQDRKILRKIVFTYLFIFPLLWIVFAEFFLGIEDILIRDGYKFYIPFIFVSMFWSIITWLWVPPQRRRKKLIYFLTFLAYLVTIVVLFSAYSLSHFGF